MDISKLDQLDFEILRDDQEKICRFSCLTSSNIPLETKLNELKSERTKLKDAEEEVTLLFGDDDLLYKIGQSFIKLSQDEVIEQIEKQQAETSKSIKEIKKKLESNKEELGRLKVELYAKFGSRINLEIP